MLLNPKDIQSQARHLARYHRAADPRIRKIFWFPNDKEVRLVETHEGVPSSEDGEIHPFYFRPSPKDDLFVTSGVALIRPEEEQHLRLPENWGDWQEAMLLEDEQ